MPLTAMIRSPTLTSLSGCSSFQVVHITFIPGDNFQHVVFLTAHEHAYAEVLRRPVNVNLKLPRVSHHDHEPVAPLQLFQESVTAALGSVDTDYGVAHSHQQIRLSVMCLV